MATGVGAHVLLLDDDEGILRLARRTLERCGYRVSAAVDAAQACAAMQAGLPDLLVLDYQLGTPASGLDFFRQMSAQGLNVPAILVTGFTDESRVIEALRSGIADVVPKAGDYLDYLPEAVARVLSQVRLRQQLAETELLRERDGHYRTIADAVPHLVWTASPAYGCDFVNGQWLEYTGLPEQAHLGVSALRLIHRADRKRVLDSWETAAHGPEEFDVECRIRRHDGAYRWFRTRGVPVRDRAGHLAKWFGTCTDIQDQREAMEERERLLAAEQSARHAAEEASRAKDRFLAMLSHELRTPLTPVLASARMLERLPDLPATVRSNLALIRRNAELEARLIDDLLDLTRVANGKMHLQFEVVDVHELIDAVVEIARSEIEGRHQRVERMLQAPSRHVRADRARLQQMLWNLLRNAVKFSPEGAVIVLRTSNEADAIEVQVVDRGIGIEPERIGGLFTAFEQGGYTTTQAFGGLGLGLAITRALADAHGGTVRAYSAGSAQGATFTLTLPVATEPQPEHSQAPPAASVATGGLRVLLLEDHPDTAEVMTCLVEGLGHAVLGAARVADALALAEREVFDLVLSDIGLPDGTGLDFIAAYRRYADTPAIALTGFGMENDVRRCLEAGFTRHLTKPVSFPLLEAMIEEVAVDKARRQAAQVGSCRDS